MLIVVPALIFIACFGGGAAVAARWLPELARGPLGGIAFFAVCGLMGAALGLAGLRIYLTVRGLEVSGLGSFEGGKAGVLADGLASILLDAGTLFGLAMIVYVLAPRGDRQAEPVAHQELGR